MRVLLSAIDGYKETSKIDNLLASWEAVKRPSDQICMAVHNTSPEILELLDAYNVQVVSVSKVTPSLYVDRFRWFEQLIMPDWEQVLCIDVRDVVFQSNPFDVLLCDLAICDEGIDHDTEDFNHRNLRYNFPVEFRKHRSHNVMNCGVIGGKGLLVKEACAAIFKKSMHSRTRHSTIDQAAYTILYHQGKIGGVTFDNTDHWCLTVGSVPYTTGELRAKGGEFINPDGVPYTIVHQYDRIPFMDYDKETNKFTEV